MKAYLYFIECLTNLHVGSGDVNYNVIDKEVEKDPVTGYPTIHASGVKGALRRAYAEANGEKTPREHLLFGKPGDNSEDDGSTGAVRFFNALFLARPLRSCGVNPSVLTTTAEALNEYVRLSNAFCGTSLETVALPEEEFGGCGFLRSDSEDKVEGDKTGILSKPLQDAVEPLLGADQPFALAKSFDDYALPVIARNNLTTDKGNLWYEEYVPHGSRFFEIVLAPEDVAIDEVIPSGEGQYVQIGGNASVGYGYCRFRRIYPKEAQHE